MQLTKQGLNDRSRLVLLNKLSAIYVNLQYDSGLVSADKAIALATEVHEPSLLAEAYKNKGCLLLRKSRFGEAKNHFNRSLSLYAGLKDKNGMGDCYSRLAELCNWTGENPEEMDMLIRKALKLFQETGNKDGQGQCYYLFARWTEFGDLDSAAVYRQISRALSLFEETGNKAGEASAYDFMAVTYEMHSNYVRALEHYLKAIALNTSAGDIYGLCNDYVNISGCYFCVNHYTKTIESAIRGLKLAEQLGDMDAQVLLYGMLGDVYHATMQNDKALMFLERGLSIAEEIGSRKRTGHILMSLHVLYMDRQNHPKAFEYLYKVLAIDKEMNSMPDLAEDYAKLAGAFVVISRYDSALINYQRTFDCLKKMGDNLTYANSVLCYGRAISKASPQELLKAGLDPGLQTELYEKSILEALETGKKLGALSVQSEALLELSVISGSKGDAGTSLAYYKRHVALKDSMLSIENAKAVSNLQIQYETEKKEQQILLLHTDNIIKGKEIYKQKAFRNWVIGGLVMVSGFLVLVFFQRNKIRKGKKRSDELLRNILPSEVAEELKAYGKAEARQFDEVTILFTDFVNFTVAGERMTPKELVSELHHCFKAFDEITGRYNIEKIKTIGDAYFAVCGLPNGDVKHAEKVVNAAIEIREFTAKRRSEVGDRTFDIRIGIHTGPVVAGIVGVKKFAYDIWGDTVNTAARLEQQSEAGRINISQATYELVKDQFECEYRGEIAAKNKAAMSMYFVEEQYKGGIMPKSSRVSIAAD
jgi:adenylate cyclase